VYLASAVVGEVGDVAGAGLRRFRFFDWSVGLFAGFDAVEEICMWVMVAVWKLWRGGRGYFWRGRFRDGGRWKPAAMNFQGSFGAAEFEAAVVDGGGHGAFVDDIEAWIAKRGLKGIRAIHCGKTWFIGEDLRVGGLIGFHGPVDDVKSNE